MILALKLGDSISPIRPLTASMMRQWSFASQCDNLNGGLMPGARLEVIEVCKKPGEMWVRAQLLGHDPAAFIKIAGEEFGHNFRRS